MVAVAMPAAGQLPRSPLPVPVTKTTRLLLLESARAGGSDHPRARKSISEAPPGRLSKTTTPGSNRLMANPSGPHDIGGLDLGPVDLGEHDTAYWEWQIDAMIRLALNKGLLTDFAELRDGIERLAPRDYEQLSYYERWARSLAYALLSKGIVGQEALDDRVAAIARRQQAEGLL